MRTTFQNYEYLETVTDKTYKTVRAYSPRGGFVGFVGCSTHTFPKWENVPEAELDARIAAQIASEEFWDGYHFAAFDSLPGREDLDRAATWNECLYRLKRRVSS